MKSPTVKKALTIMSRLDSYYSQTAAIEVTHKDGRLELRRTSPDVSMFYVVPAEGEPVEETTVVVPFKPFQVAVGDGDFDVTLARSEVEETYQGYGWDETTNTRREITRTRTVLTGGATVTDSDGCKVEVPILDLEMPELADVDAHETSEIDEPDAFLKQLEFVVSAMGTDDTRRHLAGLFCATNGDFVTTDGHRMHKIEPGIKCPYEDGLLLNRTGVLRLVEVLKMHKGTTKNPTKPWTWIWGKRGIAAVVGNMLIHVPCVDETYKFPPYERVIPSFNPERAYTQIIPNYKATITALKKVRKLNSGVFAFSHNGSQVRFTTQDIGDGTFSTVVKASVTEGTDATPDFEAGIDPSYLQQAMAPGSRWTIGKPSDAIRIEHTLGMAIVMPTRL